MTLRYLARNHLPSLVLIANEIIAAGGSVVSITHGKDSTINSEMWTLFYLAEEE